MRIVVDLQCCQTRPDSLEARLAMALVQGFQRESGDLEIMVVLNETLPDEARAVRWALREDLPPENIRTFSMPFAAGEREDGWHRTVTETVFEYAVDTLQPDCVLLPDAREGADPRSVTSVGRFRKGFDTAVIVHGPKTILDDADQSGFLRDRKAMLERSGRVFTLDAAAAKEVVEGLGRDRSGVVSLDIGALSDRPGPETVRAATRLLLSELKTLATAEPRREEGPQGKRPRLAHVSPLPPERTGIADYSAELVPALAAHYEVDLITDQDTIEGDALRPFTVRSVEWFDQHAHEYDRILYHMGNSPFHEHMLGLLERHPGVVVLHDFFLGHLMARDRRRFQVEVERSCGYSGVARLEEEGTESVLWHCPTNYGVLDRAAGVIVHSQFARRLSARFYGERLSRELAVIPLMAEVSQECSRDEARRALGLSDDEIVICSFGGLGPTKMNDRLLDAWAASNLAEQSGVRLVFVGGVPGNDWGKEIKGAADSLGKNVQITGFVDTREYQYWLSAADIGVQLRKDSRGETSKTILDCLRVGMPVIFNAHGASAEVPGEVGVRLPDTFRLGELVDALESLAASPDARRSLSEAGRAYIRDELAPELIAKKYAQAIDRFTCHGSGARQSELVDVLAGELNGQPTADSTALAEVSRSIAAMDGSPVAELLIDVSAIVREDLRTGIQRVVRAQTRKLLLDPPEGYRVEPVWLDQIDGRWHYRYARGFARQLLGLAKTDLPDDVVDPGPGDVFFGADLFGPGIVAAGEESRLFAHWRARGVKLFFTVYDILPITNPEWFPPGAGEFHGKWLDVVARDADGLICISASVEDGVRRHLASQSFKRFDELRLGHAHLGADFDESAPTNGFPEGASDVLDALKQRPTFLMVGTIEPRKGYLQTVQAFESLWSEGLDVNLVIVGREGWTGLPERARRTIPATVRAIRESPEFRRRLHWLEGVSDEYLSSVYSVADCLVAASEDEGFGLPLIEAAERGLPILSRDIPVFREVAARNASYFHADQVDDLADAIRNWLKALDRGEDLSSTDMTRYTWERNVKRLKELFAGFGWSHSMKPTTDRNEISDSSSGPSDDLRYLEQVIDTRGGRDGGTLAGKEVLVYSPPKTGSVTLYRAIRDYLAPRRGWSRPDSKVLHDHGQKSLEAVLELPEGLKPSDLSRRWIIKDLLEYKRQSGASIDIVSSYREPLGRTISLVFQTLQDLVYRDGTLREEDLTLEACRDRLIRVLRHNMRQHHPIEEIEPGFFDENQFDHERQYCFVDRGHYRILVLKLESVDMWPSAFEESFGYGELDFSAQNTADTKPIAPLYREFREWLRLDPDLVREIYYGNHPQGRQARWFYSEEQLRELYEKSLQRYCEEKV